MKTSFLESLLVVTQSSFILKQEQRPQCTVCQTPLTIKHLLIECSSSLLIKRFFFQYNLKDLFENVSMENALSFLRKIKVFEKLQI